MSAAAGAESLIEPLRRLARRAGEVILAHYGGEIDVRAKSDRAPVTLADEEAERLIVP
ncbi:MAG: 3'(2'),5'-bisphosphate nucleotidase CysQ, partial [Rhodospirillaceae bacterium]|nr:3'(2'),5'-bisphosphate nucleotidase CysQ [Rhodospirillaceae bacterium]